MDRKIYMDHAATTCLRPEVLDAMYPYFQEKFGNASSLHTFGRDARGAVDKARDQAAQAINATPEEIYFTSGGTESDNLAIKGVAEALKGKGNHIITTAIEHPAVLNTCTYLSKNGYDVTFLPVDKDGLVTPEQVAGAITDKTILISVMFANNEIGTIEPIGEIGALAREKGVLFHTDAVQATGSVPIDVDAMNIDLLSASGHKMYGPKGVGMLYIKRGVRIAPQMHGGHHERNRRAGTENVPGIVGFGQAIELATREMEENTRHLLGLRDRMMQHIEKEVPYIRLNGHRTKRLPGNVNYSFEFIEGESLILMLDMRGIAASTGSACAAGSLEPSHVLLAIGLPHEIAHGSLRLTLGRCNTMEDVDYAVEQIKSVVDRLREMSPLFAQRKEGALHV
jgi:cysteine desulfurase